MRDGLKLVEELAQEIEACEKDGAFSRKQHDFLLGYMALRQADLAFFWAQYDKTEGENVKKSHGKEILKHYYAALNELFGIKDLSMCDVQGYLPEDYQGLPMMANNICSVYTTLIGKDVIEENDYPTAIAAGECAVKLGTEVAPNVKAIFYRNLGIIYEWSQQMDKAIDAYFEAYKLDHKSPKILHCIASWHRKWFCMKYPFLDPRQTPNHIRVKAADYADAVNLLERTAYWYWLEQISNGGSVLKWPYDLSEYVSRLENRGASVDKKLMTLLDEVNQCHEDLASTKEKYMIWKQQTSPGLLALPGDKKTGKR